MYQDIESRYMFGYIFDLYPEWLPLMQQPFACGGLTEDNLLQGAFGHVVPTLLVAPIANVSPGADRLDRHLFHGLAQGQHQEDFIVRFDVKGWLKASRCTEAMIQPPSPSPWPPA
jgi:hypothetical protein